MVEKQLVVKFSSFLSIMQAMVKPNRTKILCLINIDHKKLEIELETK